MILIFGQNSDPHVNAVVQELHKNGHRYAVVDTLNFAQDGIVGRPGANLTMAAGAGKIDLSEIKSVWWRLKPTPMPTENVEALYDHYFVNREWNHFLDNLFHCNSVFEINRRSNSVYYANKHVQLRIADECGFKTPKTLIANNAEQVLKFMSGLGERRCIYKTLTPYMPPTGNITFTSLIDKSDIMERRDGLSRAPGIFQEFVEKQYELRITVVGDDMFVAKIRSNYSEACQLDWRRDQLNEIFSAGTIPPELREKILAMHRRLGLMFAAYDIIFDMQGDYVFLETNPTGQWLFIEQKTGLHISRRVARALATCQ